MNHLARHIEVPGRKAKKQQCVACPKCGSTALNKYGRVKSGKQRYLCLVCNRQFCWPHSIKAIPFRPTCPTCKTHMHVYTREVKKIRFRCSDYPQCRQYASIKLQADKGEKIFR